MTLLQKGEKCDSGYELLTSRTPNGFKISIMLEALGVEYKYRFINLGKLEQKQEWFLQRNPNGRIPVLIDHDKDIVVWESGAILLYLANKYDGKFLIKDENGKNNYPDLDIEKLKYKVMSWLFFQNAGIGPMQGQSNVFYRYAPKKIPFAINRYQNETRRLYEVMERELKLTNNKYITNNYFPTIADFALYPWIKIYFWAGVKIDGLPYLQKWMKHIKELSYVQKGLHVPQKPPKVNEAKATIQGGRATIVGNTTPRPKL